MKIDEIQNLASTTSKMASWPQGSQKGLSEIFQKTHFLNQGKALKKMSYSSAFWPNFENYQFLTLCPPRPPRKCLLHHFFWICIAQNFSWVINSKFRQIKQQILFLKVLYLSVSRFLSQLESTGSSTTKWTKLNLVLLCLFHASYILFEGGFEIPR